MISNVRDTQVPKENNRHEKDRKQLPERVFLSYSNIIFSGKDSVISFFFYLILIIVIFGV